MIGKKKFKYTIQIGLLTSTILIGALVATSIYTKSFNNPIPQDTEKGHTDVKLNRANLSRKRTITNQEELESFAKEHNIPLEVDGSSITKIETEYVPSHN